MYPVLTRSSPFDRKLRKTRKKSSRIHQFRQIVVVVRLFYAPGLSESCFGEPFDFTWSSDCHFENLGTKSKKKTCTEVTKIKTRLFQISIENRSRVPFFQVI